MKQTRRGVFETNSSNNHSYTIHIGDYTSITCYSEYKQDDVYLDESNVDEILEYLPTERLEEELKRRKGNETN